MNRFNWNAFTSYNTFFWGVSIFIVFPVSLLAFLPFLTNPGVSLISHCLNGGTRQSHAILFTFHIAVDRPRPALHISLGLSDSSSFYISFYHRDLFSSCLAVHGKIMENINLQPPAVHHMRLLFQLCTEHSVYFTTACQWFFCYIEHVAIDFLH